jgi:protein-disulfide isomerase
MTNFTDELKSSINLKLIYVLLVISLIINIYVLCNKTSSFKGGVSVSDADIELWINNNPEIILESVNKYATKMQADQQQQQSANAVENIKKYKSDLGKTKNEGYLNKKGKKTIVEFFDYDCPYCRMAAKNTRDLLGKRKDVKVILRPLVIHPSAQRATEIGYAIALTSPDKFAIYYESIMADGEGQSSALIADAVKKAGLNLDDIEKTLNSKRTEIQNLINESESLARNLGINGTPGFIFLDNQQLIPGAIDTNSMIEVLDK